MLSLPDRILAALPAFTAPPMARDVAARLYTDEPHVRKAFDALEASGRARIVRRGRGLHLVPADYPGLICVVCKAEIQRKSKYHAPKTCSYTCRMKMIWQTRDRAKQGDVFRASRKREPEKFAAGLQMLLGTPGHREHLRQLHQKLWADPVNKMQRVVAMEKAWKGPEAEPRRAKARAKQRNFWSDPKQRAKAIEAMRTGKRGRYQRALIDLVGAGAEAEEIAARIGRTLEQTRVLWRRCYRLGKVDRAPQDGRKMRPVRPKRSVQVDRGVAP